MRKLTTEEILKLRTQMVNQLAEFHRRCHRCRDIYNGDYHVVNAQTRRTKKVHEVIPATARIVVDSIVAHVRPLNFTVKFQPLKDTEAERDRADRLEEASREILLRNNAIKACSPFADAAKNSAIYGMAPVRTLYDPRQWGERPVKRSGEGNEEFEYREALWGAQRATKLPFHVAAIDPLNCLPGPGLDTPRFMFEVYRVRPFDLIEDFPDYQDPDLFTMKDFTAFWSPEQWQYYVGAEALKAGPVLDEGNPAQQMAAFLAGGSLKPVMLRPTDYNPYGVVPYTQIWSGLGKDSPEGKFEERAVGLIYPLISLLKEEARSLTAISIILQATAMPRFLTRGGPTGGITVGLAPGDVTELQNVQIEPFPEMKVPPDVYNIMQVISTQIELMLGAKLLSGARPAGVTSALFEEVLLQQAKRRYAAYIGSLEAGYARVLAQELFIWERLIKESIPGIRLKPEKIKGHYNGVIEFRYEDIAEQRIKAMIARMLFQSGLYSFVQAHEYMGTEDITGARKELIKDRLYQDPTLISALGMKMLEEMGLQKTYENAMQRLQGGQSPLQLTGPSPEEQPMLAELLKGAEGQGTPELNKGGGFGYGEGAGMPGGEEAELGVEE